MDERDRWQMACFENYRKGRQEAAKELLDLYRGCLHSDDPDAMDDFLTKLRERAGER